MPGYLRFPTLHGETIVFACEDDLWSVPAGGGQARRLTAGVSEAARPRLSPDGTRVAFTGADDGPTEICLLDLAGGGPARRLTYQAARCATAGWHPRTGEILYASAAEQPAGFGNRLFAVHPDGGPPRLLGPGTADAVAHGPGGRVVLGRNTGDPARWKRYRGGCAGELWIADGEAGPYRRLVSLPGNLAFPCWAGDRICFVSDHEGTGNVYSCRPDGGDLRRHTHHRDFYVRHLSGDGRRLVYQAGARIHLLDPAAPGNGDGSDDSDDGAGPRPVDIRITSSRDRCGRRFVPAGEHLDGARLSPDGSRLALAARGRAFTLAPWSGAVRRHGRPEGVRHRLPDWLPDASALVAVAADDGPEERLVLLPADGTGPERELLAGGFGCVTELAVSPASPVVAFATNRQELWTVDAAAERPVPRLLDTARHERIEDLAWSPDGRWLAYTFPLSPQTSAIRIADVPAGRHHQITEPVLRDSSPEFDPEGRYLYFLGQRTLTAEYDQVLFGLGFTFGARPYLVTLRDGDPSPLGRGPEQSGPAAPAGDEPGSGPEETGDGSAPPAVRIDLDGIADRVVPLPVPEGRYTALTALPGRVLVHAAPVTGPDPDASGTGAGAEAAATVTLVDLAAGEVAEDCLGPVDELSADRRGGVLLYRSGTRLRVLSADRLDQYDPDAPPGRHSGWVDLDRVRVEVRPEAEWRQMFREAWRLQRENFWDAGMSGLDWDALHARYAPLVSLVACRSELSDLIWELHGELATSHAYEQGGDHRTPPGQQPQGFLGVDWRAGPGGTGRDGWRIARVLRGDPWQSGATSPCRGPGTGIRPGDTVTAVDGRPVGPPGPGELLVGQAGREVELTVRRDGGGPPRQVTVRTVGSETRARYLDWVAANRRAVHELSGERLGYLHVPDMMGTGFADFVRGFLGELDREGLVVDVRYNTGGHISPLLLDRLARPRAGVQRGRWNGLTVHPAESPPAVMAVLVNEHTGSDGEIFAHLFRAQGLGSLVGRRTWGGVIATWPRHVLVDGTVTTQPEYRFFLRQAGDLLENRGVVPDVVADPPPFRDRSGAGDGQLAAAVAHLLDRLRRPAPPTPGADGPAADGAEPTRSSRASRTPETADTSEAAVPAGAAASHPLGRQR
ncbi:S41 family peptidase [Streptomyces aidingensis]|uniref:Tricorn protease homolog n=1 Tax=Streptomyces aidingensis TaxID=910347 RepID=A0A1I1MZT2_9ACTN|nr:S41 family peptidase [Streptomyces aidingensis]SFC88758.1 tricorn protease [Streptomyces aidingensis]